MRLLDHRGHLTKEEGRGCPRSPSGKGRARLWLPSRPKLPSPGHTDVCLVLQPWYCLRLCERLSCREAHSWRAAAFPGRHRQPALGWKGLQEKPVPGLGFPKVLCFSPCAKGQGKWGRKRGERRRKRDSEVKKRRRWRGLGGELPRSCAPLSSRAGEGLPEVWPGCTGWTDWDGYASTSPGTQQGPCSLVTRGPRSSRPRGCQTHRCPFASTWSSRHE